ncbi:MAG: DNA repair protein RecO [Phycisphaeraceae bacterium]|nr:DNA repair protein RecO [Phycisphaeraceae bacterium]
MPPLHDEAICLRHSEWSETSQLVTLLGRQSGLVRGLAKGSRRERSAFSGGFELLARGHVVFYEKPTRELANITAWDLSHTQGHLRKHLPSLWRAMYAIDLAQRALPVREPHPRTFDALCEFLEKSTIGMVHLATFQWCLLDESGHKPDLSLETSGRSIAYFLPEAGRFEADQTGGANTAWPVRIRTLLLLRSITEPQGPGTTSDEDSWTRASAFLAAYWMWVLGRPIPAARAVFGDRLATRE